MIVTISMDGEEILFGSKDGGMLQSEAWRHFQESMARTTVHVAGEGFWGSGIVHTLPLIGKYLYFPRGPIVGNIHDETGIKNNIQELIRRARERSCRWIRIEPETEEILEVIRKSVPYRVAKASRDIQPREIFVIDITADEDTLLAEMKGKTRYNVRLAEKRGVKVFISREKKYQDAFFALVGATTGRKNIAAHPRAYYEHFFSHLPEEMCQLFVAEYDGNVIAANLLIIYGKTATYLHGGSGDEHRDVMAPYLLQWEEIKYAKDRGATRYDFGGVRTDSVSNSWRGITTFKLGFSPQTATTFFPGTYDIVLSYMTYTLYRFLSAVGQMRKKILR